MTDFLITCPVATAVTQFMLRCQCMRLKPLFTTDMNRKCLAETRREPIRGGSAAASLRLTVSARYFRSMSPGIICGAAVAIAVFPGRDSGATFG